MSILRRPAVRLRGFDQVGLELYDLRLIGVILALELVDAARQREHLVVLLLAGLDGRRAFVVVDCAWVVGGRLARALVAFALRGAALSLLMPWLPAVEAL